MNKIIDVDLSEALREIARNNTFYHFENDLGISLEQIKRAAELSDPQEKMMLWVSYPSGIDCYSERQAFQRDTRDYNGIQYHGKEVQRERRLAYAIEVTGLRDGNPRGNLFQIDLPKYAEVTRNNALVSDSYRVYIGDLHDAANQTVMSKDEYAERERDWAGMIRYRRNEPSDLAKLELLMEKAQSDREATCIPADMWLHTSNLYDERRAFYSGQLLEGIAKHKEPNSPDQQAFTTELFYGVAYGYDAEQLSQLLDELPFDNAMFAVQKGRPRDMRLIVPQEEVFRYRQAEKELGSRLEQIADYVVWYGSQNTTEGNWIMGFDNLPPEFGGAAFIAEHKDRIMELLGNKSDIVADVALIDNCFDVCYYLAYCPNVEWHDEDAIMEPETVHGYTIEDSVLFPTNRGFAIAENPNAVQPFVTWQFTDENDQKDYYWGHYFKDRDKAFDDFHQRISEYRLEHDPVIKSKQNEKQKPSILAQLQESKKATVKGEDAPKSAPKRDTGLEV